MNPPRYKTEEAFRRALEQRLSSLAQQSARGLVRERQVFVFERFLARAAATEMNIVVKGGMAIELRTIRARPRRAKPSTMSAMQHTRPLGAIGAHCVGEAVPRRSAYRVGDSQQTLRLYEVNGRECVCQEQCGNDFCYVDIEVAESAP